MQYILLDTYMAYRYRSGTVNKSYVKYYRTHLSDSLIQL